MGILVVVLLSVATANDECVPTSAYPEVDISAASAARFYVDVDCLDIHYCGLLIGVWVYEETNGIDGLQRSDELQDDTCGGQIPSDRLVNS